MSTNTVQFDTRREARKSATARHQQQGELLDDRYLHKQTIESKLIGIASGNQVLNFVRCGNEEIFSTCRGCGKVERFFYACNRKWCPLCVQKLSRLRAQKLKLWSNTIRQPKHLVLTMRNFEVLTGKRIREFQQALLKLRRLKLFKEVKGAVLLWKSQRATKVGTCTLTSCWMSDGWTWRISRGNGAGW